VSGQLVINLIYILSAGLFIYGLKMLTSPATARQGNRLSAIGMLIAIVVTLFDQNIVDFTWIIVGLVVGSAIGSIAARRVEMTSMPELVALFNGFGGLASVTVACAALFGSEVSTGLAATIILSILIGSVTFTGSLVAYGKLSETIPSKAVLFAGQRVVNGAILLSIIVAAVIFSLNPDTTSGSNAFWVVIGLSFLLGIMVVIPIGGADMPVVISLLNSYSGLAACAAGFVLNNNLLIVAGSLVGASGMILTNIMCKAMNRSLGNVLFSGFGAVTQQADAIEGEVKPVVAADAYLILEAASSVAIVPGYGMAVAQAQHAVQELAEQLEENGCEVRFAVHPVAGRMPGHMNVLLAEANVPYDQLVEMDDINPQMGGIDVAIVIGANDVVNPAALDQESSPIYGMPIIHVHEAGTVIVLKRSMATGFAGLDNALFYGDNTRMLFGDAKESVMGMVAEFKG
jgi:NAD(P) transhydrogenase subunit beta